MLKPGSNLIFLMLFIFSCMKEESASFKFLNTQSSDELTAIHLFDDNQILAVGGKTWERSVALVSHDAGHEWQNITLEGRGLYAMAGDRSGKIYSCGLDKRIFTFTPQTHQQYLFGDYIAFKSLDVYDSAHIILAGGESIGKGYLYKASLSAGTMEEIFSLNREMNVVHCIDSLRWLATGFGLVIRSEDGGISWDTLDIRGEHFLDLCTIQDSVMFLCGIGGSIYRSADYGKHWLILRDATKIFVSAKPFRCICFKNINEGIVAGEQGIVWLTKDSGYHWISLEGLPDVDYLDAQYRNGNYWICGSNGTVICLKDQ